MVWGIKTFKDYVDGVNSLFEHLVSFLAPILFFDISFGYLNTALPLIVIVLLLGSLIFTIYFKFNPQLLLTQYLVKYFLKNLK